jgi:hypothetical protein
MATRSSIFVAHAAWSRIADRVDAVDRLPTKVARRFGQRSRWPKLIVGEEWLTVDQQGVVESARCRRGASSRARVRRRRRQ